MQNQQRSDKPQNSPQKSLTKIFNQQVTSIHYLYPQAKSQKNIKLYNKKKYTESQNKHHFFKGKENPYFGS